jgi:peptide/nickel transport system permease protein
MIQYIIRRIIIAIPIVFLVVTLIFFAFKLIPGDPALIFAGEQASPEAIERIKRDWGLDQPILVQYGAYLARLVRLDLGTSFITGRPVITEISERYLNTVKLALAAISFATLLGLVFGALSAVKRETIVDYLFSGLAILGISIPVFWLALLLMYIFSIQNNILPVSGNATWKHYLMPTLCLSVYSLAVVTRMFRSNLLEMLGEDFVRTARAKGLSESLVLTKHVVQNALIPVTTVVGLQFGYMLGGAVITETIFAWPGIGRLLVIAVQQRDIPVVQGILLVIVCSFVFVNMFVDILYGVIDPRIRYK